MLIKDFLDDRPMVSLFTRPRRFGKTLAMDMLRTFFEKTEENTSVYYCVYLTGDLYRQCGRIKAQLEKLLLQSASCYDTAGENFYHGLVLGLCAILEKQYDITSNRESGEGRYDIQLMPKSKQFPGILLELKAEKNCDAEALKDLSLKALQQIRDRKYDTDMIAAGVETIWKYGVAFSGKHVEIIME